MIWCDHIYLLFRIQIRSIRIFQQNQTNILCHKYKICSSLFFCLLLHETQLGTKTFFEKSAILRPFKKVTPQKQWLLCKRGKLTRTTAVLCTFFYSINRSGFDFNHCNKDLFPLFSLKARGENGFWGLFVNLLHSRDETESHPRLSDLISPKKKKKKKTKSATFIRHFG